MVVGKVAVFSIRSLVIGKVAVLSVVDVKVTVLEDVNVKVVSTSVAVITVATALHPLEI